MEYVRAISGTVYEDQLEQYASKQHIRYCEGKELIKGNRGIVDYLNSVVPSVDSTYQSKGRYTTSDYANYGFLKKHPLTGEIYTVPYTRSLLDSVLKAANPEYLYNPFLYSDTYSCNNNVDSYHEIDFNGDLSLGFSNIGPFFYDPHSHELSIDFSLLQKKYNNKILVYNDFNLEKIVEHIIERYGDDSLLHIDEINAPYMLFTGRTHISFSDKFRYPPPCCKGACFAGSSFSEDVIMQNISFSFFNNRSHSGYSFERVDFRNARFFKDFYIRNVRFSNTTKDTILSFEDARLSGNIEIYNSEFEHACLYCFQMVFGCFNKLSNAASSETVHRFSIINVSFESDSHIDLIDVEMQNGIIRLENIPLLPATDICFCNVAKWHRMKQIEYCPDIKLLIFNCEISGVMKLSNISELSFNNSRNYSMIVEAPDWKDVDRAHWKRKYKRDYRFRSNGIGRTLINNRILLAVYNNMFNDLYDKNRDNMLDLSRAYDFVMLKENFASMGLYDAEDTAFILYMEYKPLIDTSLMSKSKDAIKPNFFTRLIYKLLYCTGKYGISPLRVLVSLALSTIIFGVIIYLVSYNHVSVSYSLGSIGVPNNSTLDQLIGSLLYSLQSMIPFTSQFEPISIPVLVVSAIENFVGTFLVGYFSVAVIRKTLR